MWFQKISIPPPLWRAILPNSNKQIWWNELRYSNCLVARWGLDLFLYTSLSVPLFQKIHETPKIWHPCEQNYLFVYFNKRAIFPRGVQNFRKFRRGGGKSYGKSLLWGWYGYFLEPQYNFKTLTTELSNDRTKLSSSSYSDRFLGTTLVKTLGTLTQ